MSHQTQIFDKETEQGAAQTVPGMAHWVDVTRTDNARCRTCLHFVPAKTRTAQGILRDGQCRLWREQMSRKTFRKWPKIGYAQKACKYHEHNEDAPERYVRP